MKNFKINCIIRPKDIYNLLPSEDKKQYKNISISNVRLGNNGEAIIEFLLSEDEVVELPYSVLLMGGGTLSLKN